MSSVKARRKHLRKRVCYWDTRWGKREAARRIIRAAMASAAIANGLSRMRAIQSSRFGSRAEKSLAIVACVVQTQESVTTILKKEF